jgi:hypothetical protein
MELTAKDVAPAEGSVSGPLLVEPVYAASKFRQIAAWNSITIDHLSAAGELTLPGKFLTRAEVSDHPDRIVARVNGTPVLAPQRRVGAVLDAYDVVCDGRSLQKALVPGGPETALSIDPSLGL